MTVPEKEKKSKTQKNTCFARRHMKPGPFAFYDYAFKLSHGRNNPSGVFWSNARAHARELGVSPTTVNEWIHLLVEEDWFQCLDDGPRRRSKKTGQMMAVRYSVRDHDDWAAQHQGKCFFAEAAPVTWRKTKNKGTPVPESVTGDQELQPPTCATFFNSPVTLFPFSPVTESGTKTVKVFKTVESKTEPFNSKSPNGGDAFSQSQPNSTYQTEIQLRDIAIPKLQIALKGQKLTGTPFPLAPIFHSVAYHASELGMCFSHAMLDHAFADAMDYCKIKHVPGSRELSALYEQLAYLEKEIAAIDTKFADPMCKDRLWTQSQRKRWTRKRTKLRNDIEAHLAQHPHLREAKEA